MRRNYCAGVFGIGAVKSTNVESIGWNLHSSTLFLHQYVPEGVLRSSLLRKFQGHPNDSDGLEDVLLHSSGGQCRGYSIG